jgi:UDP-glucose 4-epimerase
MVTLVTGASGFLGRYLAAALSQSGDEVVGVGRPGIEIPSAEFERVLADRTYDVLVHAAGPASVPDSISSPERDRAGSLDVLRSVLTAAQALPTPPAILFISSAAVYGEPSGLPVAEDAPLEPVSPYGHHRVACEALLRSAASEGLRTSSLRVFSAYGEGLRVRLMWEICRQAMTGAVHLSGTGEESRDFVHAEDVGQAVTVVAERAPLTGEAYNVATGRETSVAGVARLLIAALGEEIHPSFSGEARAGDPKRWKADISRLSALGYTPKVDLAQGVARYAVWARAEGA